MRRQAQGGAQRREAGSWWVEFSNEGLGPSGCDIANVVVVAMRAAL